MAVVYQREQLPNLLGFQCFNIVWYEKVYTMSTLACHIVQLG